MASITRARSDLLTGALVRLRDEVSVGQDGLLNYRAEYVCLAQFSAQHAATFRVGATPPPPLSPKLGENNLTNLPTLTDTSNRTENGLSYFSASYVTAAIASNPSSENTIIAQLGIVLPPDTTATISTEERSFSGSYVRIQTSSVQSGPQDNITTTVTLTPVDQSYSFDYTSTSVTVENINGGSAEFDVPSPLALVSLPFNLYGASLQFVQRLVSADIVISTRATYSSGGKYTVSVTKTGTYIGGGARNPQ